MYRRALETDQRVTQDVSRSFSGYGTSKSLCGERAGMFCKRQREHGDANLTGGNQTAMLAQPTCSPHARDLPWRYSVALWLLSGALAFILCMYDMSGALINGEFLPSDHDSFYHARRIIDTVPDLTSFYQFDPRIHVPEGSWITWPWGFDWCMAAITKVAMAVTCATQPMSVIAFIAPTFVFINGALLLGIARQLRLSFALQTIVMLCFAGSMLTRALHRVGMADHHFVENAFVLLALYCGLRWFAVPNNRRAVALGAVLGLAPAFHNGDFILQLPVVSALGLLWLRDERLPAVSVATFAIMLPAITGLALLPSEPFRLGMFSYTLHSWFHLYVAACTGVMALAFNRLARNPWCLGLLVLGAALLMLPLLTQLRLGSQFLFGLLVELDKMPEVSSVFDFVRRGEYAALIRQYSYLLWLLPMGLFWVWRRLHTGYSQMNLFLAVFSLFGVSLMMLQFRFQYFGSFALWLLPCVFVEDVIERWAPSRRKLVTLALAGTAGIAMLPSLLTLQIPLAPGADFSYMNLRDMFLALRNVCALRPGTVLADHNHGHYITYHTNCSVISDNFLLTRQHEEKLVLTDRLLRGSVEEVRRVAPYVRYLLIARADDVTENECFPTCNTNLGLRHELIEAAPPFPPGVRYLAETRAEIHGHIEPLARLFALDPINDAGHRLKGRDPTSDDLLQ